jgi:hypothetical protein
MGFGDFNQFYGVIARASNIGQRSGNYTEEMFKADFPQFYSSFGDCHVPQTVLAEFITQANGTIVPDKWLDGWRYAAGLYVAHQATMYLRTFGNGPLGHTDTPAQAAASGQVIGTVKSASLGDASASYDDGSSTSGTEAWGDLNATIYGQMLANKAKLIGMGGSYVL